MGGARALLNGPIFEGQVLLPKPLPAEGPGDLGYNDLRVPETREAQAELARKAGIEGFA
jgi:hypothetical protein